MSMFISSIRRKRLVLRWEYFRTEQNENLHFSFVSRKKKEMSTLFIFYFLIFIIIRRNSAASEAISWHSISLYLIHFMNKNE